MIENRKQYDEKHAHTLRKMLVNIDQQFLEPMDLNDFILSTL